MKLLDFNELAAFIIKNKQKKVAITFHSIGDRDGVSSAISLASFFPRSAVVTPDYLTGNAKRMLRQAGYSDAIKTSIPAETELLIIMDTNLLESIGELGIRARKANCQMLFIDHHLLPPNIRSSEGTIFNDEGYNSTASIIYALLKIVGAKITKGMAILLVNGIISDSAELQNSTYTTFMQISELLEIASMDYADVIELMHDNISPKDRYTIINEIKDSEIEIVGKYIFIHGKAVLHANVAADIAIRIGADASLFWTVAKKEASASARLRAPLDKRLHMHLGVLMQEVGIMLNGNGGGHPCAAGAYGPFKDNINAAVSKAEEGIKERLLQ